MRNIMDLINKARDIRDGRHGARFYLSEVEEWLHNDLEQLAIAIEELNAERDNVEVYAAEMEQAAGETNTKGAA